MMNKYNLFALVAGCVFCFVLFVSYGEGFDNFLNTTENLPQTIKAVDVNHKVFDFAGEAMPLTMDCKERLDREFLVNSYRHSHTVQYIKLAERYFPIIEKILNEHSIPDDFKYLAVAESGLRHVTSPANAKGFWQFRKLAAKEMDLEVNDEVDERYHLVKSTIAACKYILRLKKRFGTWTDAAAAYNLGPTNYAETLSDQREDSYFKLNLPEETMRYMFRLIALKEVLKDPEKFGFYIDPLEKYPPFQDYYEVLVDTSVNNWGVFAHNYGLSYRELKRYNPWLRDNHLTVIKNTYHIKIPKYPGN